MLGHLYNLLVKSGVEIVIQIIKSIVRNDFMPSSLHRVYGISVVWSHGHIFT